MIEYCNFPDLAEPYATALRQAVAYIIERFEPIGIIAAGSIMRGEGDSRSDIDTFVIFEGDYRQRVQKFFNGVRFEIFANPPQRVPRYFADEQRNGGASTSHMIATGHVVLNRASIVDDLIQQAREALQQTPNPSADMLNFQRYMASDRFENALDLRYRDPAMAYVMLSAALPDMLVYYFISQKKWVPRHKDLLATLRHENPELARLVHELAAAQGDKRFDIACQIADKTLGTRGFFEWESDPQKIE